MFFYGEELEVAEEEKGGVCIESGMPDSSRIYFEMVKLPS